MTRADWKSKGVRFLIVGLSSIAPVAFPLSQMGYGSLHTLAIFLILPSAAALALAWLLFRQMGHQDMSSLLARASLSGIVATMALELVRYPGFRLGFMPGNLPDLMGVLLLDRLVLGPSTSSTLAGFAYHFWNGACFSIIFGLFLGKRSRWWAIPYGIAIGLGFLVSPVVQALGGGIFGLEFGWTFAATVLTAHTAFGATLAYLPFRSAPHASTNIAATQ